jgi:hypothetical protein
MAVWIYTLAIKINSLALLQMLNKSLMVVGGLGTAILDLESLPSDTSLLPNGNLCIKLPGSRPASG